MEGEALLAHVIECDGRNLNNVAQESTDFKGSNEFQEDNEFKESSQFKESNEFHENNEFKESGEFKDNTELKENNGFQESSEFKENNEFQASNEFKENEFREIADVRESGEVKETNQVSDEAKESGEGKGSGEGAETNDSMEITAVVGITEWKEGGEEKAMVVKEDIGDGAVKNELSLVKKESEEDDDDADPGPLPDLVTGAIFKNFNVLKLAVCRDALDNNYAFRVKKKDSERMMLLCKQAGGAECTWKLSASKGKLGVKVISYQSEHSCERGDYSKRNPINCGVFLKEILAPMVQENPNRKPKDLMDQIWRQLGYKPNYKQVANIAVKLKREFLTEGAKTYKPIPGFFERVKKDTSCDETTPDDYFDMGTGC